MPNFAISSYPDAKKINKKLDDLAALPVYRVKPEIMRKYETEYYAGKCQKSMGIATAAKEKIPGGMGYGQFAEHPFPVVFAKAEDAYLYDADGNRYYDLLQSGGANILGANPPAVSEKIAEVLNVCGSCAGLPHEYEYMLADKICGAMPAVQTFRIFDSGSEASMAAIRAARLATGRKKILKMGGAYHGWSDQLVYSSRLPGSGKTWVYGVPATCFKGIAEFSPGDLNEAEKQLRKKNVAAVITEPLGIKGGTRPVDEGFNKGLEALCRKYGALLIFDETDTALRLGMGGAQGYFGILPDLTVFGKSVFGGYPGAGGLGGKREYMKCLENVRTDKKSKLILTGEAPVAALINSAAGYYTICELESTDAAQKAGLLGDRLTSGLSGLIEKYGMPFVAYNYGSICHLQITGSEQLSINRSKPWQARGILKNSEARRKESGIFSAACMAEGLVTRGGTRLYVSAVCTEQIIDDAVACFDRVLRNVERKG